MFDLIRNIFKKKLVIWPNNSSWMIDEENHIIWKNVERCLEFDRLKRTNHSKRWHEEGSPFEHTKLVCKEMQKYVSSMNVSFNERDKKVLMLAALCHDLGKATTTYWDSKEQDWKCKSHGEAGEKITRNLLMDEPIDIREEICWLVRYHMEFHHFLDKPFNKQYSRICELSNGNSTIEKLLILNYCDTLGSKCKGNTKENASRRFHEIMMIANQNNCYRTPLKQVNNNYEFTVYFMIGIPGAGKDTYISKHFRKYPIVCRDNLREEMIDGNVIGRKLIFDKEKENIITDRVNEMIKNLCLGRHSFVINQMNHKKKGRAILKEEIFKYAKPRIVYVYVEPPTIEDAIKRREKDILESVIRKKWNEMDFPDKSECDELIIEKQN